LHKKNTENLEKTLSEIRQDLILKNSISFTDATHRTNFCKKLIYLIKKMHSVVCRTPKDSTFEEKFFVVFKYLLRRGANYLKQEDLHLLNSMVRAAAHSSFSFYKNFRDFLEAQK
jgi:hypothetical protein